MKRFLADIYANSINEIEPQALVNRGILWLAVDVDNTLALPDSPALSNKNSDWLYKIKAARLPVILVSNNSKKRVEEFAKSCGVLFVSRAMKPLGFGLKKAATLAGFPLKKGALIGDQLFTDVYAARRKGMMAILVKPMVAEQGRFLTFKRRLEQKIISKYLKKVDKS